MPTPFLSKRFTFTNFGAFSLFIAFSILLCVVYPLKSMAFTASVVQTKVSPNNEIEQEAKILNIKTNQSIKEFLDQLQEGSLEIGDKADTLSVQEAISYREIVTNIHSDASVGRDDDQSESASYYVGESLVAPLANRLELYPNYRANLFKFGYYPKIWIGVFDREDKFPAVVLLPGTGNQNCSATVIGPKWVITAAHCACKVGFNKILYGRNITESKSIDIAEGPYYFDKSICKNNEWKKEYSKRDVALYKLKGSFPKPHHGLVQPSNSPLEHVSIVGFGKTEVNPLGGFRYYAEVPIASESCSSSQRDDLGRSAPNQFNCIEDIEMVAASESFKDTCNGDSGGPAFRKIDEGGADLFQLAGITSRGINDECGEGGIYVRIDKSLSDWINGCTSGLNETCTQQVSFLQQKFINVAMISGDRHNE